MRIIIKVKVLIVSLILTGCTDYIYNQEELSKILGIPVNNSSKVYAKEQWGGIHGDGYIINIYRLSGESVNNFLTNKNLKDFPTSHLSSDLMVEKWQMTPIKKDFEEVKKLSINYYSNDNNINKYQNEIAELLEITGSYYAFYYNYNIESPDKIYFYLLNPSSKLLYIISSKI